MVDLPALLAVLELDPDDAQALEALVASARQTPPDVRASRFAAARKLIGDRGRPDIVVQLIDAELATTGDVDRKVDLLLDKGMTLDGDLLDVASARDAFDAVIALRPDDTMAKEAIAELAIAATNWQKFAAKYIQEATASTDRSLATGLYRSAAEAYVRFAPAAPEAEGYLRKALDIDPRNNKAAFHLTRLLRRGQRWDDLAKHLEQRAEHAPATEDKIAALLALAELARGPLDGPARADDAIRRALVLDPAQSQALRAVADAHASAGNWTALVAAYQAALKARRADADDVGMLMQIGMVLWRHLNDLDQAEEYFRRIRKVDPSHPAAVDFYRVYYPAKGENGKLLALLKQVEKSAAPSGPVGTEGSGGSGSGPRARMPNSNSTGDQSKPIGVEIAELAESQNNPEKAIEQWKQVLRAEPASTAARTALARLYQRTEKWNALLDLMKDEVERLPEGDIAARVARLLDVVAIYRDRLRLDVMVINTYNAILKLDPDNRRASDELAAKFRALGRWNDLITVLTRRADAVDLSEADRVTQLREVADLWAERFGNFANAIKPLERILELAPTDVDAVTRLKDIYTRRRQWRQLIDVLGREAAMLTGAERRTKQGEMARLAAERLGDAKLAIEIHNEVLAGAAADGNADVGDTLTALAGLYDREKRYPAVAEILHRQVARARAAGATKDAVALLEKLGQVYAERLLASPQAAAAWQEVLELEPSHGKALRTLRELYATAGDFAGLEALYARLGQEDELVEALLGIADRLDGKAARLPLVERAAVLAHKRAEAATGAAATTQLERARQVWERVLAVDAQHVGAAAALAPIYAKQEKWARLIAVLEIQLSSITDRDARLAKIGEIRALCEQRLSSRNLAFMWTLRAFELDPASESLFNEVLRLADQVEQWREVAATFDRHLAGKTVALAEDTRLRLLRELARIASRRLNDAERARDYQRRVLELAGDDHEAEAHLEELAIQVADWPALLASYRRRAAREHDATDRAVLLLEIAALQEDKLVDLDGAAATYHEVLAVVPGQVQALRALARIEEARGDWEALAGVLVQELGNLTTSAADAQVRFDLLMRLGQLEEQALERPARALAHFRDALAIAAANGAVRAPAVAAVTRFVTDAATKLSPADRVAAARLVQPHLEAGKQIVELAAALEVIRGADGDGPADAAEKLELDRQLMRLYHGELGDPAAAWQAGLRVLAADPADSEVRGALGVLAGQLGRDGEWAKELASALTKLKQQGPSSEVRAVATELARVAGERLADRAVADRAWLTVLEVEPDAADAFEALTAAYRGEQRFMDLRALLERRTQVSLDERVRRAVLLELAGLEEDVLGDPGRAAAAHRRVLEIDASYAGSYQALDRLYAAGQQWRELEELLARQVDHAKTPRDQLELAYRRAELFAHRLGDAGRAVDLLDDVIGRQRSHADARELLEELMPRPEVTMRVARLLEPLYEQDKLWKDLVGVLRAQRALVGTTEAVELLARIATIEESELAGTGRAFDAWVEILGLDPAHERARIELSRLAQWLSRWPEATAALERAAAAAPRDDVATRAALLGDLAAYYDVQLGDAAHAITAYQRLLEADPGSPATVRRAGAALARLYEEGEQWGELRAVTRRQAEWAEDPSERRALLARVAALEEDKLHDREAAIATWRDVIADQPGDAGALHALERLYQATEKWRDLIEVLRRKLDGAGAPDARQLLARIAEIHEVMLEEPGEAIAAHLEVLDRADAADAADHRRHPLGELARLYREAKRHADLLDVLERQTQHATGGDQIALHVEIAHLLAGPLGRAIDALERWSTVLRDDPQHAGALAAIEGALHDLDLRAIASDILRPVYDATGQDEKLAQLLTRIADWSDEPAGKLRALAEVVRLREYRLGDKQGAFAAQLAALKHAGAEPELAQVVVETERLAGELGAEGQLIDAYRELAPHVLDAEIQRRLYLDVADLSRAVRRDLPLARDYYQKVLDAQPDDRRALAALESIYRETGDDLHLTEVLLRQAEAAGADGDDKVGALVEAAQLYVQLKRPDDAIATWEHVLAVAPERRDAVDALESLYREQNRWPDVIDLYDRRLGFATSIDEAVALRVQLGDIHERNMRDIESALDNYAAALSGDPRHAVALAALERFLGDPDVRAAAAEVLEPIYVGQHRWVDLIRVYEAKLEAASDPRERLKLTRFVARLYEEQLEDFEHASHWYAKVFREAPEDPGVRDQLQRLASIVDNWPFVAATYQQYLDDESGESSDLREVAIAAATIYDRRLGDVVRAYAAYRRALAIDIEDAVPDVRELVRRLEELLGRSQKWNELAAIYDDVIARGDDELRREALIKRARLLEDGLGDTARAIDAWREVVMATESGDGGGAKVEHAYREAVGELDRLYRVRGQWHDLGELYEARLGRTASDSEIAELRLKHAEMLETELHDLPRAIDQHEQVIAEGRGWDRAVAALERLVVHEGHRERIAALLEPVYRDQDWWQKLVVILDAKLAFVHDPHDQVHTLHEIALIHEQRGGALDLALTALARAWRIDVADDASLAKLLDLAGKLAAWDEVTHTLEEGATATHDPELAAELWARTAELHETQRGDVAAAIAAWRKVDDQRPDDLIALAALDRLLALDGRVHELVKVVARRAELTEDAGVRLVLLHRVSALYEEVIGDASAAIDAYKQVLAVDDADMDALDALERLYRGRIAHAAPGAGSAAAINADARDLVGVLERKIELTAELSSRQALRRAAAAVFETQLADIYQAIGQLNAVLDDDAGDATALAELDRIYAKERMWPELLDVVDRRALLAISAKDRAELAFRAARLVEAELRDPDAAIPRHGAVLQVLPSHAGARAALETLMAHDDHVDAATPLLERVYRADHDAAGLVRVYERRLLASAVANRDPDARRADWTALAEVHETIAQQPGVAFATWGRALAADPEDLELLAPLIRIADGEQLWPQLAALLDERLAAGALPAEVEQAFAIRLGEISEDRLGDLDRAARAFDRATHGPEPRPALAALERVLARSGKFAELAAVLRRQADAAEDDAQTAEYLFRLGDLYETTLADAPAAVAAYREVLAIVPAHLSSRSALERMLASRHDVRASIVEILEPLFEQDGDAARLANVLDARLEVTDDALDRANLLARLVELTEGQLGDRGRALDAALRWLAADPASHHALTEVDRLAGALAAWAEVAMRVGAIVDARDASARNPDVQVGLLTFLGRVQRERLGELDAAAGSYRAALALEPEAHAALDELITIHRVRKDDAGLADALRHRGAIVQDVAERRAAFAEVALLAESAGDRPGAIAAWREIADRDDSDRDALDELARIYRDVRGRDGDPAALIDVLGRAARLASSESDEQHLRVEIAQLEGDSPRAVAAWQAVLDLDGEDVAALAALEAAHARAGDWLAVGDTQSRRLALARGSADKLAILADIARLAETKRDALDDAVASWYQALDVDSAYRPAYAELERLLTGAARWHDVIDVLERLAELEGTLGNGAAELGALARAADIWESKLDNPDAAGEILEKILAREPGSVAALTRLSKIYERAGDWAKCKQVLEQALAVSGDHASAHDSADLFFRLGEVARVGDDDHDTAILHYQQALRHEPAHAAAIGALESLARERRDGVLLADMLQRRAATITNVAERVALLVELADLEGKAGHADAALAALSRAAADAPTDARVLGPLADLYVTAGRLDEAAPIYDRLAADAKTGRRMKDVARYRQRQGTILEARNDRAGALVAYEEALRVNPTDTTTMVGLGRLYFAEQDWEKARKIYQSLVLQNIDADAGVSKAEVYFALGTIHLQLGQPPKAKSMFQRGLEIEPSNPKLKAALAQVAT